MFGVMMSLSAEMLVGYVGSYTFVTHRKSALDSLRFSVSVMEESLESLQAGDLIDITDSSLEFLDIDGNSISFRHDVYMFNKALYKGGNPIAPNVKKFKVDYFDEAGVQLVADPANINDVRRIRFVIETDPIGNEGVLYMTGSITPRSFLGYKNFE